MATTKKSQIPPENLAFYEKLLASANIERKGDVHPYTSVNGHMCTYLDQAGTLGIRLSKEDAEAFVKRYNSKPFESYGVVKKDWVAVPHTLLKNTKELKRYLDLSYAFTKTLKPK